VGTYPWLRRWLSTFGVDSKKIVEPNENMVCGQIGHVWAGRGLSERLPATVDLVTSASKRVPIVLVSLMPPNQHRSRCTSKEEQYRAIRHFNTPLLCIYTEKVLQAL
jgi:hypothetical protein